jgi:hypothetical protein
MMLVITKLLQVITILLLMKTFMLLVITKLLQVITIMLLMKRL